MEIVYRSAAALAAAIRAGEVTATEAVEAHLARIEACNPTLNAVVTLDAERALRRARAADEALARGEIWGPLHGVPYTLKDGHATAGMRTTSGFPPLAGHVPREDGTVAARLMAAGGVLLGKTNVPPLLDDIQTDNAIFGRTGNPWDPTRTPGGSSGGAAAALAAGMTPFEVGSDIGGSIRVPAHFCGVFGLKPTERRVPLHGHIPELPGATRAVRVMACIGPMARDVADLSLLYPILAGPDGHDTEVPPVPVEPVPDLTLAGLRIAVAETFPGHPVSGGTRSAMRRLASSLAAEGAEVEEAPLPDVDFDPNRTFEPAGLAISAVEPGDAGPPVTLRAYLEALHRRDTHINAWERFFEAWDALACPASTAAAFQHKKAGSPHDLDGEEVGYWAANAHARLFNYTGHPAVAMPFTQDAHGLPLGFQLVGRRWGESRLLGIAAAVSRVTGPFQRPPGY